MKRCQRKCPVCLRLKIVTYLGWEEDKKEDGTNMTDKAGNQLYKFYCLECWWEETKKPWGGGGEPK